MESVLLHAVCYCHGNFKYVVTIEVLPWRRVGGGGGGGEIDCYFCCHGGRVIYKESGYIVKNWEAIDGGYSLDDVRFMCDHCHIYDRFREKGPNARFFNILKV